MIGNMDIKQPQYMISSGGGNWGSGEDVTIVDGAITIENGKWYKIETQGGAASDDLDTVNGLSAGEQVMLSAVDGAHTVVLKNGTGNLDIQVDTSLSNTTSRMILISDGTNLVEASSRP